jgi:uncharacterized protein (DUF58 family)
MPTPRAALILMILSVPLALSAWAPAAAWLTLLGDAALVALWLWDGSRVRAARRQVEARRECLDIFSLGVPNLVRVRLRSRATLPLYVTLVDDPPQPWGFGAGRARGLLPAYGEWDHGYALTPDKRGNYAFGRVYARFTSALGLAFVQRRFDLAQEVRVYPNVAQLREYDLLARRDQLALLGLHRLREPVTAAEFDSLRDYVPDDELRRVEWKATARRGKLVVKQYEAERMQTLFLVLDCGRTMASQVEGVSKLDHAINACVLLSHVAAGMEDRIGLLAFADEELGYLPPGKGRHQAARVTDFLYPLHPRLVESDYRLILTGVATRQPRRALVMVFTDLIDPESSARLLRYLPLLARRHQVLCVALSDWELARELRQAPAEPQRMFEQVVALEIQEDRQRAIARLTGQRVAVLNATPADLSVATVNRYLAIKRGRG